MKKLLYVDQGDIRDNDIQFYQLPKAIVKNKNLTLAQKFVYMELLDKVKYSASEGKKVNSKGQPYAEVSIIRLAENLGVSDRTVKDAIDILIEEKLIFCSRGKYKKSKKKNDCNRYYVYLPVGPIEEVDEVPEEIIDEEIPDEII